MNVVIQRVSSASVAVDGETISEIGHGLLILAAVEKGDTRDLMDACAGKIVSLRIFSDDSGRMNRSLEEVTGEILAVSQFTLAGSIRKGRRPSFDNAEEPNRARELFDHFVIALGREGTTVKTGRFGAMMDVCLVNDGPVTFTLRMKSEE